MYPVTSRYLETIARSTRRLIKVEILNDGAVAETLTAGEIADPATGLVVQTIGGSVQVDRTAIRRSGNVTFLDVSGQLLPDDAHDLFASLSTEIRPWVGVQYWDATSAEIAAGTDTEYVPLATLVVTDVQGAYPTLEISGYDRMWLMGPFAAAYSILSGTACDDALRELLSSQVPPNRLDTSIPDTEFTTGAQLYTEQTDSVQVAQDLANAAGWQLYVDPMGVFTARAESSFDDDPVMVYAPGKASMLMRPKRAISASASYNAVVFTGEATSGPPVRGYAQDDNPNSITYAPRVGVRPYFASSPLVRTAAQAQTAASTRLQNILGIPESLVVPIIPNHALESGDVISVADPAQGLNTNVLADSFPLPIRASDGAQQLACRCNGAWNTNVIDINPGPIVTGFPPPPPPPPPPPSDLKVVQSAKATGGTGSSASVTFATPPVTGNLILLGVSWSPTNGGEITNPLDDTAWQQLADNVSGTDTALRIFYKISDGSETTTTVTTATSNAFMSCAAVEIQGQAADPLWLNGISMIDQAALAQTPQLVTPNVIGCLGIFFSAVDRNSTSLTVNTAGYTIDQTQIRDFHQIAVGHRNTLSLDTTTALGPAVTWSAGTSGLLTGELAFILIGPTPSLPPPAYPPNPPVIGTATAGQLSAIVAFTLGPVDSTHDAATSISAISSLGPTYDGLDTTSPDTITGLTAGTPVSFQLRAVNGAGSSAISAASNSVTPLSGPTPPSGGIGPDGTNKPLNVADFSTTPTVTVACTWAAIQAAIVTAQTSSGSTDYVIGVGDGTLTGNGVGANKGSNRGVFTADLLGPGGNLGANRSRRILVKPTSGYGGITVNNGFKVVDVDGVVFAGFIVNGGVHLDCNNSAFWRINTQNAKCRKATQCEFVEVYCSGHATPAADPDDTADFWAADCNNINGLIVNGCWFGPSWNPCNGKHIDSLQWEGYASQSGRTCSKQQAFGVQILNTYLVGRLQTNSWAGKTIITNCLLLNLPAMVSVYPTPPGACVYGGTAVINGGSLYHQSYWKDVTIVGDVTSAIGVKTAGHGMVSVVNCKYNGSVGTNTGWTKITTSAVALHLSTPDFATIWA